VPRLPCHATPRPAASTPWREPELETYLLVNMITAVLSFAIGWMCGYVACLLLFDGMLRN
jgi:hypothetical protein